MKKLLFVFIFLLAFPWLGISQDVEYYRSVADTSHNPISKLVALDSVVSKSFKKDDDTFIVFSIQYIKLAKELDSIELAAKKAMNLQHILTSYKNDPRRAITIINEVLANKYKIKDSFLLAGLYLKRGGSYFRIDMQKAIEDYTTALNIFGQKDSIYKADAYLFRGQAFSNLGKFVPAGEDFKAAYTYYENLKDYEYMLYAHQGNITMYSMNGFYEKAKIERDHLIKKLTQLNLNERLASSYYNQSVDYKKTNKPKLQLNYLLKADSLFKKHNIKKTLYFVIIHSKLTEYYANDYEFEKAEKHLQILEDNITKFNDDLFAESYYCSANAVYYEKTENFEKALEFANKKIEISHKLNHEEDKMESHLLLSNIYYKTEDFKKSIDNKNEYYEIKDSIYNQSSANALAYFQTLYETEKKEKELVKKNTSIQLLEKNNYFVKKLSIATAIAIALLFGLILLYRNQKELRNNKLLQEKYSQDLLQYQENEHIRISKDLHDGIGQKLLILKNKLTESDNRILVNETIDEVRAISRDLYPFQLQELGITKAIEHTITQIDENTTLFISSEIDNIDNLFQKEQEVNIYRIVQESLSNIIKHAKAEASKVTIKKLTDKIVISIKDNGVGFDFTEKHKETNSLGLKTLLERTKFLHGQMKIQSKKGDGTLIEFIFPII
ncbi:MAG: sensor histidine kinase [Flavobacteriaceae bacterium]|nr:sensor histidine kinase [Flavobacteriaceae bacterium]